MLTLEARSRNSTASGEAGSASAADRPALCPVTQAVEQRLVARCQRSLVCMGLIGLSLFRLKQFTDAAGLLDAISIVLSKTEAEA